MDVLIKSNGEYEKKTFGETELVDWFKEHTTDEGDVTEDIVLFNDTEVKADGDGKIQWVMSDYSLDRDNERIDPAGWELKNYKANPIVLWGHNMWDPAIGKASNVKVKDEQLVGTIEFDLDDPLGVRIDGKVRKGIITKGSVGFRSKKIEIVEQDDKEKAELIHRKQELYEFSIVNIPSNLNARVQLSAEPEVEKDIPNAKTQVVIEETTAGKNVVTFNSSEELMKDLNGATDSYINTIFQDRDETSHVDETSLQHMFKEDDDKITIEEFLNGTT